MNGLSCGSPKEPPPPPPVDLPWSETPSSVEHLDEQTFKNYIKRKKHALIIFYAPCESYANVVK